MIKRQDGKYENKNTGEVIEEKDYFKWVKEIGECDEAYNNLSQVEKNIIDSDSEKSYREGYHHGFESVLCDDIYVDLRPVEFLCYASFQILFDNFEQVFILVVKEYPIRLRVKPFKIVHHCRIHA